MSVRPSSHLMSTSFVLLFLSISICSTLFSLSVFSLTLCSFSMSTLANHAASSRCVSPSKPFILHSLCPSWSKGFHRTCPLCGSYRPFQSINIQRKLYCVRPEICCILCFVAYFSLSHISHQDIMFKCMEQMPFCQIRPRQILRLRQHILTLQDKSNQTRAVEISSKWKFSKHWKTHTIKLWPKKGLQEVHCVGIHISLCKLIFTPRWLRWRLQHVCAHSEKYKTLLAGRRKKWKQFQYVHPHRRSLGKNWNLKAKVFFAVLNCNTWIYVRFTAR